MSYRKEVIAPGDLVSQIGRDVSFASHKNCPAVIVIPHEPGNFRGSVGFTWQPEILKQMQKLIFSSQVHQSREVIDWKMIQEMQNDGAGGKPQFHALIGDPKVFYYLGHEIIAMNSDDFARKGHLPGVIANDINFKGINEENIFLAEALFEGYGQALRDNNLVNITGESAIMRNSVTAFCDTGDPGQLILNWGAACVGLASSKLAFQPQYITSGMPIVALFEPESYRCNGGGFFVKLIMKIYGTKPEELVKNSEVIDFCRRLAVPSTIYSRTLCRLAGWTDDFKYMSPLADIKGVAHITGGGVWNKFGELLPQGIGAYLDSMPNPPDVLLEGQEKASRFDELTFSDDEAYENFHGGCGMIMVVKNERAAAKVIEEAAKDNILAGVIGWTDNSGELKIRSRFLSETGKMISRRLK